MERDEVTLPWRPDGRGLVGVQPFEGPFGGGLVDVPEGEADPLRAPARDEET